MENIDKRGQNTSLFNTGMSHLMNGSVKIREITDNLIEDLLGISIMEFCDFNSKNYIFMQRLMYVNINEKMITLQNIGIDASYNGDSDYISNMALHPSYVADIDYSDFQTYVKSAEKSGKLTTNVVVQTNKTEYGGLHNEIYKQTTNLYPDDEDKGTFSNKWNFDLPKDKWDMKSSQNSILYKTKLLFQENKINTIISRFHTNGNIDYNGSKGTETYKESHGKNLLKKGAPYQINGYDNPYCRVWTHHYQYDRLYKRIRPFYELDNKGEYNSDYSPSLSDFHKWKNFITSNGYGWKNGNVGWDKSVLQDNGFPNITPKYVTGGKSNIHTKQCMFSIENLAWKDFDPYKFEQTLSWEQRGPNGGRIMWFPPYGITFNETTQAVWNNNTFIGRGEDVFTYVNTRRTGTLSFLMVVDHPSIIDYITYSEGKKDANGNTIKIDDETLLRFFSGCDEELKDLALPTELTDEYTIEKTKPVTIIAQKYKEPIKPDPEPVPDEELSVSFFVFYPNNYSGAYDAPTTNGSVHAIAYLLNGMNAQKNGKSDIPITMKNLNIDEGLGYELNPMPITDISLENNYIIGSLKPFNAGTTSPYVEQKNKKWYYRIDGEYTVPKGKNIYTNTYGQTLYDRDGKVGNPEDNLNYRDTESYNLNADVEKIKEGNLITDTKNYYSLLEVAAAICKLDSYNESYEFLSSKADTERINKLIDVFENYELVSYTASGYSNNHGYNESKNVNTMRNNYLAEQRTQTVRDWIKESNQGKWKEVSGKCEIITTPNSPVNIKDKYNTSALSAKLYRSALITMNFKKNNTVKLAETQQTTNENGVEKIDGIQKYVGFSKSYKDENGNTIFINDKDNSKWKEVKDNGDTGELIKIDTEDSESVLVYRTDDTATVNAGKDTKNRVRYDQEYHFFEVLKSKDKIVYDKLMDKIKYFDPAFHSMTPEGFNARLTFLQQCTRQGDTITKSDVNGKTANNLAFGRPPFCVLRIGDFYNQMIVIDSINIDYSVSDGIQWDLNTEGIGVQPLLASININFSFIGGGDLGGPIRRLQNAMTFNYYANTRLYDNRADRIEYEWDEKSSKNGEIKDTSYAHNVLKEE